MISGEIPAKPLRASRPARKVHGAEAETLHVARLQSVPGSQAGCDNEAVSSKGFQASVRSDKAPARPRRGRACKTHDASAALVQVAMASPPSSLAQGDAKMP